MAEPAFSRGFSGGIWWVPSEGVFKLWYGCGAGEMPQAHTQSERLLVMYGCTLTGSCDSRHFHQGTLRATCVAVSADGRTWSKPVLTAAQCSGSDTCIAGTNIVHNVSYAGNVIWLDLEETDPLQLCEFTSHLPLPLWVLGLF